MTFDPAFIAFPDINELHVLAVEDISHVRRNKYDLTLKRAVGDGSICMKSGGVIHLSADGMDQFGLAFDRIRVIRERTVKEVLNGSF